MAKNKPSTLSNQNSATSSADEDKNKISLQLRTSVIAAPLRNQMLQQPNKDGIIYKSATKADTSHQVVIDVNLSYYFGRRPAREWVLQAVRELIQSQPESPQQLDDHRNENNQQYVFASLTADTIQQLINRDRNDNKNIPEKEEPNHEGSPNLTEYTQQDKVKLAIHRIWPDFQARALINRSISTVKADAARASFMASGEGIVWAVADSGIDQNHPHLKNNIHPTATFHRDFTVFQKEDENPFLDQTGHGTHVAGIIAGEMTAETGKKLSIFRKNDIDYNDTKYIQEKISSITGMAPKCILVSLKVLDANNVGDSSAIIAALTHIQEINGYGRDIKIHGVNLSLGYPFDAKWYACGQSPLCVEVDRLVKSGVVVVVAAGNTGFGDAGVVDDIVISSGMSMSINDPGNAEFAITVGSTHRDKPYTFGVSYFSSKGPTGDGRPKPDLVAPGERIVSCAAGRNRSDLVNALEAGTLPDNQAVYVEDSGTSMAAPHVSGVIASFLSIRQEFIGQPEVVKELFMQSATSLKRDPNYQGKGLIDLMRTIQAV